jgi:cytochrome c556
MSKPNVNCRRIMSMLFVVVIATAAAVASAQQTVASGDPGTPPVTIKELMEKTITPASNTIWGAYEAPTDEAEWQALEEAAVTMLLASWTASVGGSGPMDNEWVKQPAWQAFNDVMTKASRDALAAIRARDHDALLQAGDVLYPPCEGCHLQFNPAVVEENQ